MVSWKNIWKRILFTLAIHYTYWLNKIEIRIAETSRLRTVFLATHVQTQYGLSTALCRKAYTGIFHVHALIAYTKVLCKFIIHYLQILVLASGQSGALCKYIFALLIFQLKTLTENVSTSTTFRVRFIENRHNEKTSSEARMYFFTYSTVTRDKYILVKAPSY